MILKFGYSRKQLQSLYLPLQVPHLFHTTSSCPYLHLILWIPSERLLILTRFDEQSAINLPIKSTNKMKSARCSFRNFFSVLTILASYFFIGTKKVMSFLAFSPKQVNSPSNSSANSFMIKWYSYLDPLSKATEIYLGTLHFKLYMLCAAPLSFPVYWQRSLTLRYCLSLTFLS